MPLRVLRAAVLLLLLLGDPSPLLRSQQAPPATETTPLRDRYTKREVLIPMRDGVKLFTAIYTPKDPARTYPVLLQRTPYSVRPYGADAFPAELGPSPRFQQEGFIFVYQDVRGRMMSEGDFVNMRPSGA